VHTAVETPEYLAAAAKAGMTDSERDRALVTVINKSKTANLTKAQVNELKKGKPK